MGRPSNAPFRTIVFETRLKMVPCQSNCKVLKPVKVLINVSENCGAGGGRRFGYMSLPICECLGRWVLPKQDVQITFHLMRVT